MLTATKKIKYYRFLYDTLRIVSIFFSGIDKNDNSLVLQANRKILLKSTKDSIITPYELSLQTIFNQPSSLIDEDECLNSDQIREFFNDLKSKGKLIRLNHLGFCYRVNSITKHKKDIIKISRDNQFMTYEMESSDNSEWVFVGNTCNWREPMLEFLPLEGETVDKEIDYWLPHIHICIDTNLSFKEIKKSVDQIYKGLRIATLNYYGDYITQVRVWVGVVSGINLYLDIGTFAQNMRYARKVLLTKIG